MGQRAKILAQVVGFPGFKVVDLWFENEVGERVKPIGGYDVPAEYGLVLALDAAGRLVAGSASR